MSDERKKLPARFFRSSTGNEPVRDWLLALSKADRKTIGVDISTVEYGWPIGMPACRPMGQRLWEVRSDLGKNRIARVLFCVSEGHMILLHGFVKKTQKTPKADLDIARERMKELEK
jgi:phage-related protein